MRHNERPVYSNSYSATGHDNLNELMEVGIFELLKEGSEIIATCQHYDSFRYRGTIFYRESGEGIWEA